MIGWLLRTICRAKGHDWDPVGHWIPDFRTGHSWLKITGTVCRRCGKTYGPQPKEAK